VEQVLRQSRAGAGSAVLLVTVAAACWLVTADRMRGMDMGPGTDLGSLGWFTGVWVVMMAAMMLPSLAPREDAMFAAGFLLTWTAAGVLAYGVIQRVRGLDPELLHWASGGQYVAAAVVTIAGIYELTTPKRACLQRCRLPRSSALGFLGAFRAGLENGTYCIGCCWALMAVLFAIGVMNVAWMAVIAAVIAIEKLAPWEFHSRLGVAVLLVALGITLALAPAQVPALTIPG
jgi:predicted metal-binding membrane protein